MENNEKCLTCSTGCTKAPPPQSTPAKTMDLSKVIAIIGIIAGIILFIASFYPFEDESVRQATRYVGGDAYNFIIESNLIAGRNVSSAIYRVGSIILMFLATHKLVAKK